MAATSPTEYKKIQVTGPVSVEHVDRLPQSSIVGRDYCSILLMGPTGAGKSTFIESLALRDAERISSNQLGGFTQTLSTYKINNVLDSDADPIYLVDAPGFADTKISEMAIVSMVQKWMKDNGGGYFNRILYLIPITQVRLPGSQRQVLKTFQALTGVKTAKNVTIVTTMWDSIGGERARARAEGTYAQLESDIWREFIEEGSRISKFLNTEDSTLLVLDEALNGGTPAYFNVEVNQGSAFRERQFADNLYRDLQDRIQNLHMEIPQIQADLALAESEANQLLLDLHRTRLEEAEKLLEKFMEELQEFGPAPGEEYPAGKPEDEVQQRARLSRALDFILGCGCRGKGVEENHEA